MRLVIEIESMNAEVAELGDGEAAQEYLRYVARRLTERRWSGRVMDGNGNAVGTWELVPSIDTRPMRADEVRGGRYVCVMHPADGCLHSPHITILSGGVWVRSGQAWSSGHGDCVEAYAAEWAGNG